MNSKTDVIITRLKKGDERCLAEIYKIYRNDFLSWTSRKFLISEEEAKDIFQNTLIAFYQQVSSGRLDSLDCDLRTYLFAVAKNKLLREQKKSQRFINLSDAEDTNQYTDPVKDTDETAHQQILVKKALEQLGGECSKVLKLFYFNNFELDSVAEELGYKNRNVAKVKKSQCLRKLAKLLQNQEQI